MGRRDPRAPPARGAPSPPCSVQPAFNADGDAALRVDRQPATSSYDAPGARTKAGVWDVATGASVVALRGRDLDHAGASSATTARLLLTRDADTARVWDASTGEALATMRGHGSSNVESLASASFSPDGRLVLTSGADGTTKVWDAQTGERVAAPRPVDDPGGLHDLVRPLQP